MESYKIETYFINPKTINGCKTGMVVVVLPNRPMFKYVEDSGQFYSICNNFVSYFVDGACGKAKTDEKNLQETIKEYTVLDVLVTQFIKRYSNSKKSVVTPLTMDDLDDTFMNQYFPTTFGEDLTLLTAHTMLTVFTKDGQFYLADGGKKGQPEKDFKKVKDKLIPTK